MKQLIVNADDFGLTEGVNQGIIAGHLHGSITSASLLANGSAFESAVRLSRAHPTLGVGVHLNLTEGRPVSKTASIPSLTGGRNAFPSSPLLFALRLLWRRVALAEVERELRAQIEKVLAAGLQITHLDGHKHIHLLPAIFNLAIKVAREYRVGCVRCPVEGPTNWIGLIRRNPTAWLAVLKQHLLARALSRLAAGQGGKLKRAGLTCPVHLFGITTTGFLDLECLEEILRGLPEGTSEIMCHPGYVDAALRRTPTRLLRQRATEVEALTRPEIKRLLTDLGIELITYGDLVPDVRRDRSAVPARSRLVQEVAGGSSL